MTRASVVVFAIFLILLAAGNVVAQPAKPISNIKDIAGKWAGQVVYPTGVTAFATMTIKEDGTYETIWTWEIREGRERAGSSGERGQWVIRGAIQVSDGKARFKNDREETGTLMLYEDEKGPVLRSERDDGSAPNVWTPAK